ncbi:lipocalin/fatty acid-binding family protein [Aestuariivivens insulae]|uniref:hypothetical protein n=1 Tax=Aestuariivivens insulae TaxID=1621988 RepID=UPI001F5A9D8A|nr:hypothetical protein [Aestuariivivens insulae]
MIGLELQTDNKTISASIENGGVQIFVNKVSGNKNGNTGLTFTAYNKEDGNMITFYKKNELSLGDKFIIKVVDVIENSPYIEINPLIMSKEKLIEQKLMNYRVLKKELEELNLI